MATTASIKPGLEGQGYEYRAYDVLEKDFQEVLQELAGDESLERFRIEYEKLFRALRKTHDNEKRLVKKCRELNSEIVSNAAKVQTALALSDEDQATIVALKREIEKAWRAVDASHEKEAKAKETVTALKGEIASLQKLAEDGGAPLGTAEEAALAELTQQKEELAQEVGAHVDVIVGLRSDVGELTERLRQAEAGKAEAEASIESLKLQVHEKRQDAERELRRRERLEKDARELKAALDAKQAELKGKQVEVAGVEEQVTRLEGRLREAKTAADKAQKEYNSTCERVQKLHLDLDAQVHTNTQLLAENSSRQQELRQREEEAAALRADIAKNTKMKEAAAKRIKSLEDAKAGVEAEREALSIQMAALQRDTDLAHREAEAATRKLQEVLQERDSLNKLKTQAENATSRQADLMKVTENTKKNLEAEIAGYRAEAQRQLKKISALEQERDQYAVACNEASAKHQQALEEVRLREAGIVEMQKKVDEGEARLRQQQTLYESVRAERNQASKKLIEAQDDIGEAKRKFKVTSHQITQLKEEVAAKDLTLVKEHFEHMKVQKELDSLKIELGKAKGQIASADDALIGQKAELRNLAAVIGEADAERTRQRREYDAVVNERDILGTQLIRRNDELALLYEKLKLQAATLARGHEQYRDRLAEIRALKLKMAELRRELGLLRSSAANVDLLKREVAGLGKALLYERTKVRALSDELEHPLNVHRWRKLEGSDPTTYEMIQKIQTLQKRLISKTEEVVEKDMLIQEKERLYVELKTILARQPGPEAAEQLSLYQAMLREKTKQLKSMAAELNMYQAQVSEYNYEMERLTSELNTLKRRWLESKRREQQVIKSK